MISAMIVCLALNGYHEARGEPYKGQIAVAEVVIERMHKRMWPNTSCDVVYQNKQFSWTIGYVPHKLKHRPYQQAVKAAQVALTGTHYARGADHYHSIDIITPDWADDMEVVQVIGNHIFYRSTYE